MTFLFYLDSDFASGAEAQILRNLTLVGKSGAEVFVVFRGGASLESAIRTATNNLQERLVEIRSNVFDRALEKTRTGRVLLDQIRFCRSFIFGIRCSLKIRPEIVHVNNGGYPGAAGSRGFSLGAKIAAPRAKFVISVHNLAVGYRSAPRWLDFIPDLIQSLTNVTWVTASKAASERLREVLPGKRGTYVVIPNGVVSPSCNCSNVAVPKHFEISPKRETKVALSVGHLEDRKGHSTLIEAVAQLRDQGRLPVDWKFDIEGEGELHQTLRSQIDAAGLRGLVTLLGRVKCLNQTLHGASLFIHPSIKNEDLPNVISEAMSVGVAVVASRVGGIPEQVEHGKTGLIFKPGDASGLASQIIELCTNESLRRNFGSAALKSYSEKFSPTIALGKYIELYEQKGTVDN